VPRDARCTVSLRRAAASAVLVLNCAWAVPARADAPIPACRGHNPAAAASARAEGLRHYRASKRDGRDDAEMATALGFFDAACAAGDDGALELRAYALAGVERFVEAAQTLDAFLVLHPLVTLPSATRARLAAQQPAILSRVASLSIETDVPGAKVTINNQPAGTTPLHALRLVPGRYDIEVTGEGIGTIARSVDLSTGERTERFSAAAPTQPAQAVRAPAHEVASGEHPPAHGTLQPWAIGTAVGAGVLLLGGIGGTLWANERVDYYDSNNCAAVDKAGCSSTLSQSKAARGLEVAGFVGAGAGAILSGILFYLDRKRSHAAPPTAVGLSCTVIGAGLSCGGRF
jgi:hypothetical protein